MPRYLLSTRAAFDLENLLIAGIERFGLAQTDVYIAGLMRTIELIAEFPKIGRVVSGIRRRFIYEAHVIVYMKQGQMILVEAIIHSRTIRLPL